jgi:site-specific DNA recombinase
MEHAGSNPCPRLPKSAEFGGQRRVIAQAAEANRIHPKVVRQALRLAFLSPDVTSAILEGHQPAGLSLAQIPKLLALSWAEHRRLLG